MTVENIIVNNGVVHTNHSLVLTNVNNVGTSNQILATNHAWKNSISLDLEELAYDIEVRFKGTTLKKDDLVKYISELKLIEENEMVRAAYNDYLMVAKLAKE